MVNGLKKAGEKEQGKASRKHLSTWQALVQAREQAY